MGLTSAILCLGLILLADGFKWMHTCCRRDYAIQKGSDQAAVTCVCRVLISEGPQQTGLQFLFLAAGSAHPPVAIVEMQ